MKRALIVVSIMVLMASAAAAETQSAANLLTNSSKELASCNVSYRDSLLDLNRQLSVVRDAAQNTSKTFDEFSRRTPFARFGSDTMSPKIDVSRDKGHGAGHGRIAGRGRERCRRDARRRRAAPVRLPGGRARCRDAPPPAPRAVRPPRRSPPPVLPPLPE